MQAMGLLRIFATPSHFSGGVFDEDDAYARLGALKTQSAAPDLWNNPQAARRVLRERTRLEDAIEAVVHIETSLEDTRAFLALAREEGDGDAERDARASLATLRTEAVRRRMEALLSGEADGNDCYLEVHAGAGGTESQDWAAMLLRMYERWARAHGYKSELVSQSAGEEAGIKSATLKLLGAHAYGWLKTEQGVHRLVRISPFDSNARRHTSFASVSVFPVIDDSITIEVKDSDVRIDTYRASGAGGQHVNTTDSAVRITHLKTGIVVQCQNERSQHKNRAAAWTMLRARLYEAELRARREKEEARQSNKDAIEWGSQIRSYVLQPYQLVKDVRTQVESAQPASVLDGNLDAFLTAALSAGLGGKQT